MLSSLAFERICLNDKDCTFYETQLLLTELSFYTFWQPLAFIDLYTFVLILYCTENKKTSRSSKSLRKYNKITSKLRTIPKSKSLSPETSIFSRFKRNIFETAVYMESLRKSWGSFLRSGITRKYQRFKCYQFSIIQSVYQFSNITNCVTEFIHANVMKQCSV